MQVINIKESGSNNTLLWAIKNGANILKEEHLHGIINEELFYLVTFSDVNLFDIYHLSLLYRNKARIVKMHQPQNPTDKELEYLFPGEVNIGGEDPTSISSVVKVNIEEFVNLILQMESDSDIIAPYIRNMLIPMIIRKYDVQIPVSFVDFISPMNNDQVEEIFNADYPSTLDLVVNTEAHLVKNYLELGLLKSTEMVKHNPKYDKFLEITKYSALDTYKNMYVRNDTIYRYALSSFRKFEILNRGELRCNMFNVNKDEMNALLPKLNKSTAPLIFDFVIEVPIFMMMCIANAFSEDILQIKYVSSIKDIMKNGLPSNDIILPKKNEDNNSEEDPETINEQNGQISAYSVRLSEADKTLINSIKLILDQSSEGTDLTALFSILPSMYMTKAVVSFKYEDLDKITSYNDDLISALFTSIALLAENIEMKIRNS